MRVLIINKFLYPNGGSETYIIGWKKWHKKKNTRLGERIRKIFSTRRVFHSAGMCPIRG